MDDLQDNLSLGRFFPLIQATLFYAFVFITTHLGRKVVYYFFPRPSTAHYFCIEFLATACMTTCVYENGIILANYGVIGFFFIVISILLTGSYINRGGMINPLAVMEGFYKGIISNERLIALVTAQLLGAYSSYRLANSIWFYSMDYAPEHAKFFKSLPCTFAYKIPFWQAMFFEFAGTFALRALIHRIPANIKWYVFPAIVSFFLSIAFVYVGIPGLNPITISARMMNCKGLDTQWFIFLYWVIPAAGWFLAAELDPPGAMIQAPQNQPVKQKSTKAGRGRRK